jgi:hypothetical protein
MSSEADENERQESTDPEEELKEALDSAAAKGRQIAQFGRELAGSGQGLADWADATNRLASIYASPEYIEGLIDIWKTADRHADQILAQTKKINVTAVNSTINTSGSATSDAYSDPRLYQQIPRQDADKFIAARTNLYLVAQRTTNTEDVSTLMRHLGLDASPPDQISPLEKFETAHNTLATLDTPHSSLVDIRESMRAAVDALLKKRPKQEKTPSNWTKIISIGTQLKRDEAPDNLIKAWAAQYDRAMDYLSKAKIANISRDEIRNRMIRATAFLSGFLGGLDPGKLRK